MSLLFASTYSQEDLLYISLHLVHFAYLPNMGKYKWMAWSQRVNLCNYKQRICHWKKEEKEIFEKLRKTDARIYCNLVWEQSNWNLPLNRCNISCPPTPQQGWKMSIGFCQLFSSYSELHHSEVITYFFASSILPEQSEYIFIQPTGSSFINSLLVSYPAKT